jgi:hypothetical protein
VPAKRQAPHKPVTQFTSERTTGSDSHLEEQLTSQGIVAQYEKFGAIEMDFEGKNVMIYYLGDRTPLQDVYTPVPHMVRGPAGPQHWWKLSDCNSVKAT